MGGKRCRSRCRHWKDDKAIAPVNKALRQRLGGSRIINASRVSVSYDTIGVFAEKGKLVLTDGKLSTKFEKGGQMKRSFMWIQQVVSVCSKLRVKIFKGSPTPPISNALETPPPQNDDPLPGSA